jgi:hypothetical protein
MERRQPEGGSNVSMIYKYPITAYGRQQIKLRLDQILCVQPQGDTPTLWALVDDQLPEVVLSIIVVFTGENIPPNDMDYIGTVLVRDGHFVLHVFVESVEEVKEDAK